MKAPVLKPVQIKKGSVIARIYPTPRDGYDAYTLVFYRDW